MLEKHNTGICKHADAAKKKKKDMEKKKWKGHPGRGEGGRPDIIKRKDSTGVMDVRPSVEGTVGGEVRSRRRHPREDTRQSAW